MLGLLVQRPRRRKIGLGRVRSSEPMLIEIVSCEVLVFSGKFLV